jgi:hypothetical protein
MDNDVEFWCLQVWSEKKTNEFWDVSFWMRKPGDEKGVATFLEATPRLNWMSEKALKEVWAYLQEQKRLGRLLFSFTKENERLMGDLLQKREYRKGAPTALRDRR